MKKRNTIEIFLSNLVSLTLVLISCGGGGGGASVGSSGVNSAKVVSELKTPVQRGINISPRNLLGIKSGAQLQFTAAGFYSDNSVRDITTLATWITSDPSVARVSNESGSTGKAIAVSRGYCSISAMFEGVSVSTAIGVI